MGDLRKGSRMANHNLLRRANGNMVAVNFCYDLTLITVRRGILNRSCWGVGTHHRPPHFGCHWTFQHQSELRIIIKSHIFNYQKFEKMLLREIHSVTDGVSRTWTAVTGQPARAMVRVVDVGMGSSVFNVRSKP
jgi:hypothetical protein